MSILLETSTILTYLRSPFAAFAPLRKWLIFPNFAATLRSLRTLKQVVDFVQLRSLRSSPYYYGPLKGSSVVTPSSRLRFTLRLGLAVRNAPAYR